MSVAVMSMVYRATLGSPTRKAVALKLADHANDEGGNIWPSIKRLAKDTEVSERTIQRTLRDLEDEKLLIVVKPGGGHCATQYRLSLAKLRELERREDTGDSLSPPIQHGDVTGDSLSPQGCHGVTLTIIEPSREVIPLPPSGASPKGDRGARLPDDFVVPSEWREWAADKAPRFAAMIDHEAEKFCDHWRAATGAKARKRDWAGTWRNWWRTAVERAPRTFNMLPTPRQRADDEARRVLRQMELEATR